MSDVYGYNFNTLYHLDLATLYDVVHIIRDGDAMIAPDHDVLIRGCIIPFLRSAAKAPRSAEKDEILRLSLIAAAKKLGVSFDDWGQVHTDRIASATRRQIQTLVLQRFDAMDPDRRAEVLGVARDNLRESASKMGVPLVGASTIIAGEMSGFGIYLATTTGLHALSLALGVTFPWGIYQGATALLGIILGPVGWAVAGVGVAGGLVAAVSGWMKGRTERKLVLAVSALLFAIGESPFEFFGLGSNASYDDIRSTYRAMMKTLHPDKLEQGLPQWLYDDFNEKLLRCQEAYEQLQSIYDQHKAGDNKHE